MNEIKEYFNKVAPIWDGYKRNPALDDYLASFPIKEGMNVSDVACGTGVITESLYQITKRKVNAIDISDKMIEIAEKKFPKEEAYFRCLDFYELNNEKYDALMVYNAYAHFLDAEAFAKKAFESLNNNGYLIIFHDRSKEALAEHHKFVEKISRILLPVNEEVKPFLKYLKPIRLEDNESHYIIIMQKA